MSDPGRHDLERILSEVASGALGVDEALALLPLLQISRLGEFARLDPGRGLRKGVPEVVYAPRKSDEALAAIVRELLDNPGAALVARLGGEREERLRAEVLGEEAPRQEAPEEAGRSPGGWGRVSWRYQGGGRGGESGILEAIAPGYEIPTGKGAVGVMTAGTSDIPVAEEACLVARHMGCAVYRAFDVGVAGVHRLLEPLTEMIAEPVDALVVVAGMEGALPSVVAGLVDIPVVGVPTSTGYGFGGDGTAALSSILQSCSPGLVAVNIDNGVGAGAAAALIARRRAPRDPDAAAG